MRPGSLSSILSDFFPSFIHSWDKLWARSYSRQQRSNDQLNRKSFCSHSAYIPVDGLRLLISQKKSWLQETRSVEQTVKQGKVTESDWLRVGFRMDTLVTFDSELTATKQTIMYRWEQGEEASGDYSRQAKALGCEQAWQIIGTERSQWGRRVEVTGTNGMRWNRMKDQNI